MGCHGDELLLASHLNTIKVLLVQFVLQSVCTGPSAPTSPLVIAELGGEVILPCHLESPADATLFTLEWTRPDLHPKFVYVWRDGQELPGKRHQLFEGRTSLLSDELKRGNVSLKISRVRISDEGTYRCFIPSQGKQSFVQLVAASGSICSPDISVAGIDKDRKVLLQCKSAGWYPEPEMFWLDVKGNVLSARPAETTRGPDGLYSVSSSVTAEKGDNFICMVQQKTTNRTREAHIYLPEDLFVSPSWPVSVVVALAFAATLCILLVSAGSIFIWKWRRNLMLHGDAEKPENENTIKEEEDKLMAENISSAELLRTKEELHKSEKMVEELKQELEKSTLETEKLQIQLMNQQPAQTSWFSKLFSTSNNQQKDKPSKEDIKLEDIETKWKTIEDELEDKKKELKNKTSALQQTKRHVDELLAENRQLKEEKFHLEKNMKKK